ncbi:MAG: vitamin B12-dependent ribonucleotide reductase [Anaerofustis stercorihominis]|nr:vitamin B12-dependent ribonucleotide reductase [Anaerofustis stercorihominis]
MSELKNILQRKYTTCLQDDKTKTVYDLFEYEKIDAKIVDHSTGDVIVDMRDLEFPVGYSKNACNIIASKYFRKAGINDEFGHETSMKQLADRMVGFWADALMDEGIIETKEEWQIFYDEMVYALLSQKWAPNSPQWFNTGIKRNYGIAGDSDDMYYYDEKQGKVVLSPDRYTRTQASACFILSIADSLIGPHSISEQFVTETKLFKGGSGVGTNFSTLRGVNEKLSSGGVSSGVMSFLKGLDRNAGAIKSGGTTRRAAKMLILDIDHPEIEEFISWKAKEEDKVRALGKMGYDVSMDGEAYSTVSGQNGNNSVRVSEDFMKKVLNLDKDPDSTIKINGIVDSSVNREKSVKELWDLISQCAWACADPALQFDDLYNGWHTCPAGEDGVYGAKYNRINATNPCSEYAFLDDTSCNLASINIYNFFNNDTKKVDLDGFIHVVGLVQLVLEASIHRGQFPTEDIARKTHMFRTTGLGIANLASLLMVLGFAYDSDEARNTAAAVCSIMTGYSYYVSALMAKKVGAFEKYDINKEHVLRVLRNHARCAGALGGEFEGLTYVPFSVDKNILSKNGLEDLANVAKNCWEIALVEANEYGVRNAQVSVIAPTGTISFAMDCGATSIEPFYSHVVYKKLVGGGVLEIINPIIEQTLENLGYSAEEIRLVSDYLLEKNESGMFVHYSLLDCPEIRPEHRKIFENANEISPEGHVLMVAAITPMISGSVSKTVNMVSTATTEDISDIYKLAYKTGVKAISIYRDGCKASQPLTMGDDSGDDQSDLSKYTYAELLQFAKNCRNSLSKRLRPGGMRMSRTHSAKIGDIELYVTIGFYPDGNMAELFVSSDKEGTVVKGLLASLSKAISNMLQYNVPPKEIARILRGQQFEPSGFVSRHPYIKSASSIADLISKIIDIELEDFSRCQVKPQDFIPIVPNKQKVKVVDMKPVVNKEDIEKGERVYGELCPECSSTRLFKNGTCKVCADCGSTTGCS